MKTKNYRTNLARLAAVLVFAAVTSASAMAQVPFSLSHYEPFEPHDWAHNGLTDDEHGTTHENISDRNWTHDNMGLGWNGLWTVYEGQPDFFNYVYLGHDDISEGYFGVGSYDESIVGRRFVEDWKNPPTSGTIIIRASLYNKYKYDMSAFRGFGVFDEDRNELIRFGAINDYQYGYSIDGGETYVEAYNFNASDDGDRPLEHKISWQYLEELTGGYGNTGTAKYDYLIRFVIPTDPKEHEEEPISVDVDLRDDRFDRFRDGPVSVAFISSNSYEIQWQDVWVLKDTWRHEDSFSDEVFSLTDDTDNSSKLGDNEGLVYEKLKLQCRTLYKDGRWDTMCLPFDIALSYPHEIWADNPVVMTLNTETSNFTNGTLTLNFEPAPNIIPAGTPFIIKWNSASGTITDPVFENVLIQYCKRIQIEFDNGSGHSWLWGTLIPEAFTPGYKGNLFFGDDNKLYWASSANNADGEFHLGPFRFYIDLFLPWYNNTLRTIHINYGNEEQITQIMEMPLTANLASGAYWTTFYSDAGNYQAPEGTQVFTVNLTGTTLTLNEITDRIVKSGEGVVLKQSTTSSNATTTIPMTLTNATPTGDFSGNSLTGTMTSITNPGNAYVLGGKSGVGFYKLSASGTIGANKAYLTYSGALAKEFFGFDESSADGIGSIDNGQLTIDNEGEDIYTLDGRRLQGKPATKGIYIVNGKKTVIK